MIVSISVRIGVKHIFLLGVVNIYIVGIFFVERDGRK